jgi:chorismate dehydratase
MRGIVDFIEAVPARCADYLSQARVEAALIPVIEYQRLSDVSIVPDVCVGSKEEVWSVVLVSRKRELERITSVALDESSRTSATLIKVIFREFLQSDPEWTVHSPNIEEMLGRSDAALMIGDPAMVFPRESLHIWDLARLWRNYTGLGFVFAMWAIRNSAIERSRQVDFKAACEDGLAKMDEIIEHYHKLLGLTRESLRHYLVENICFAPDEQLRSGMNLYFELAHKHKLLSEVKPLKTV